MSYGLAGPFIYKSQFTTLKAKGITALVLNFNYLYSAYLPGQSNPYKCKSLFLLNRKANDKY